MDTDTSSSSCSSNSTVNYSEELVCTTLNKKSGKFTKTNYLANINRDKVDSSEQCSSNTFSFHDNKIIVLSDSSTEEDDGKKEHFSSELNKDNTLLESHQFNLITNQINDKKKGKVHSKKNLPVNHEKKLNNLEANIHKTSSRRKNIKLQKPPDKKASEELLIKNNKFNKKNDGGKNLQKFNYSEKYLKEIIINIDESVFQNLDYGEYVRNHLDNNSTSYRTRSTLPNLISWSRKIAGNKNEDVHESELNEKHYLLILMPYQFGSLMQLINKIKEFTNFHHLSVYVYGLGKPTNLQEEEILEVEMFFSTFWQFVKNKEDLSSFIFMATKCIAQMPYKIEKEMYFNESNKDAVRIDKKGNGLSRLWRQMLTMFPMARLETAEAITTVYPTLSSLFQAYKEFPDGAETLIQEIPIRRAQGPLASVKKLGPELSRKCYKFFTSEENILL